MAEEKLCRAIDEAIGKVLAAEDKLSGNDKLLTEACHKILRYLYKEKCGR